jgi:hypothetical protein
MRKETRARKARRTHGGRNVLIIAPQYIRSFACNATGWLPENRAFCRPETRRLPTGFSVTCLSDRPQRGKLPKTLPSSRCIWSADNTNPHAELCSRRSRYSPKTLQAPSGSPSETSGYFAKDNASQDVWLKETQCAVSLTPALNSSYMLHVGSRAV